MDVVLAFIKQFNEFYGLFYKMHSSKEIQHEFRVFGMRQI